DRHSLSAVDGQPRRKPRVEISPVHIVGSGFEMSGHGGGAVVRKCRQHRMFSGLLVGPSSFESRSKAGTRRTNAGVEAWCSSANFLCCCDKSMKLIQFERIIEIPA